MKNSNGFESFIAHKTVTGSVVRRHTCFFLFFCNSPFRNALPLFICLRNSVFCITYLQKNLKKKPNKKQKTKNKHKNKLNVKQMLT